MRRIRKSPKNQEQPEPEVSTDLVAFDDVLSRELHSPSVIDLEPESAFAGATPITPAVDGLQIDLPQLESRQIGVDAAAARPGDIEPRIATSTGSALQDSTDEENAALRAELLGMPAAREPIAPTVDTRAVDTSLAPTPSPTFRPIQPSAPSAPSTSASSENPQISTADQVAVAEAPAPTARGVVGFDQFDFWDRYDEATASADLFAVPPAAITVVVGSLDIAMAVAERCQANHWVNECDVFVLTERRQIPGQPTWTALRRPSEVVAVLDEAQSDFPLIVLDIPRELPAWVRPLIARLRQSGVGLVHYVLDNDPSDEDLATWHGELGRPSVLDLACPVAPERVLELLDRGEPVSSVAGMDITTELLLALRLNR